MNGVILSYSFNQIQEMVKDLQTLQETHKYPKHLFIQRSQDSWGILHLYMSAPNLQTIKIQFSLFPGKAYEFVSESNKQLSQTKALKLLKGIKAPKEVLAKLKQPVTVESWIKVASEQKKGQSSITTEVREKNSLEEWASFKTSFEGIPASISITPSCRLAWNEIMGRRGELPAQSLLFEIDLKLDFDVAQKRATDSLTKREFSFFPGKVEDSYYRSNQKPVYTILLRKEEENIPSKIKWVLDKYPTFNHLALWERTGTVLRLLFINQEGSPSHICFHLELLPQELLLSPMGDHNTKVFQPTSCSWATPDLEQMRRFVSLLSEEEIIQKDSSILELAQKWDEETVKKKQRKEYSNRFFSGKIGDLSLKANLTATKKSPHSITITLYYDLEPLRQKILRELDEHFEIISGYMVP